MSTRVPHHRVTVLAAALALIVSLAHPAAAFAAENDDRGVQLLFTQQDTVMAFDLVSGAGYQTGTAVGLISGTSFVSFQFAPSGPPVGDALPITFHNKVIITDIDGDQIAFDNDGTGTFHLGVPGAPFQGSGGPLRGTYVVTAATGKFSHWKIGSKYAYKAIATNPPAPPDRLGTVYVEVTTRGRNDHDRK